MPTIDIRRLYADGDVLTEADLDAIVDDVETFLNTTKIDGDNIQAAAIDTAQLATAAVTQAKIASGAVGSSELATDAVTSAKIATAAVDTDELATDAVTTIKITDANVTREKLEAVGEQLSAGTVGVLVTGAAYADVTGFTGVTITTSGRPVVIMLQADTTGTAPGGIRLEQGLNTGALKFVRDSTDVAIFTGENLSTNDIMIPCGGFFAIDIVGAGTYTYKMQGKGDGSNGFNIRPCKLLVYEL